MSVGANIAKLRIAAGFASQTEFAAALGVPVSRVNDLENDRYVMPDTRTLLKVAATLNTKRPDLRVTVDALIAGVDPTYDGTRAAAQRDDAYRLDVDVSDYKRSSVPVIAEGEASARGLSWGADDRRWNEHDEWLSRPFDLREPNAYAIVVRNDSMEPMFKRGWRLIISPNQPVTAGEAGFVFLRSGERLIKLVHSAPGGYMLESVNAVDNPPRFVPKEDVEAIHRVVYVKLLKSAPGTRKRGGGFVRERHHVVVDHPDEMPEAARESDDDHDD